MNIKVNFISWKRQKKVFFCCCLLHGLPFMRWMLISVCCCLSSWWRLRSETFIVQTLFALMSPSVRCSNKMQKGRRVKCLRFNSHKSFQSLTPPIPLKISLSVYNRHMVWGFIVLENSIDKIYVFTDEALEDYFVRNVDNKIHKHALELPLTTESKAFSKILA